MIGFKYQVLANIIDRAAVAFKGFSWVCQGTLPLRLLHLKLIVLFHRSLDLCNPSESA